MSRQTLVMLVGNLARYKLHRGFTMIELMTVVAIIGVLAAIAIPQYQIYVVKSQVTRAMGEASYVKDIVEQCLSQGKTAIGVGVNQCDPQAVGSNILVGGSQSTPLPPGFIGGVPLVNMGPPVTVVAAFGNNAHSSLLGGQTVVWTSEVFGSWTCTSPLVANSYKPIGCI